MSKSKLRSAVKELRLLVAQGPESSSQITQILLTWKRSFSIAWYELNFPPPSFSLSDYWILLFELAEFSESNVVIATFNCLGALLLALWPYIPEVLLDGFSTIALILAVSPNTSVALLSTFSFFAHRLPSHRIRAWAESVPILQHFGADLRPYVNYIPKLITEMTDLPVQFHKAMLRSLVTSLGYSATDDFVTCLVVLLNRFPKVLMQDLMDFIESNRLDRLLLGCGAAVLKDPTLSKFVSREQRLAIFELAKSQFSDDGKGASDVEKAVGILLALREVSEEDFRQMSLDFCESLKQKDCKPYIKRLILELTLDFEDLRPVESDLPSDLPAKISAMAHFSPQFDAQILEICLQYIDSRDQAFVAVLELFTAKPSIVLDHCDLSVPFLEAVIARQDFNWVQRRAIVTLIGVLNQFAIPSKLYISLCLRFLVDSALDPQKDVSESARAVCARFLGRHNTRQFMGILRQADLFELRSIESLILLLNAVIHDMNLDAFRELPPLITELIVLNPEAPFLTSAFRFLSHFRHVRVTRYLIDLCLDKLCELYYAFTGKALMPAQSRSESPLAVMSTDIVTASLSINDLFAPIVDCFLFLDACRSAPTRFAQLACELLPLVPRFSLQLLLQLRPDHKTLPQTMATVQHILQNIKAASVCTACCHFFRQYGCPDSVLATIEELIASKSVNSASFADAIVQCFATRDPDTAGQFAVILLKALPAAQEFEFAVRLSYPPALGMAHFLLNHYPFLRLDTDDAAVRNWYRAHAINDWPLTSSARYTARLVAMMNAAGEKYPLAQDSVIDVDHCVFIVLNRDLFVPAQLLDFMTDRANQDRLKRFMNFQPTAPFVCQTVAGSVSKRATAAPQLRRGIIPNSQILVKTFFMFSSRRIPEAVVAKITELFPQLAPIAADYKKRLFGRSSAVPPDLSIAEIVANFSVKSRNLREQCRLAREAIPAVVEVQRMAMTERLSEVKSGKSAFCILRFLRETMSIGGERKRSAYRKSTAERIATILKVCGWDCDFLRVELVALLRALFPANRIEVLTANRPDLWPILTRSTPDTEDDVRLEIPSFIRNILRTPDFGCALRALDLANCANFLLGESIIQFFASHQNQNIDPFAYLPIVLNPTSPYFTINAAFAVRLLRQASPSLPRLDPFVTRIPLEGYSVAHAADICCEYYQLLRQLPAVSHSPLQYEMQCLDALQRIFISNPNWTVTSRLSATLIRDAEYWDIGNLLLGSLALLDHGFFFIWIAARSYYKSASATDKERFRGMLARFQANSPRRSRHAALRRMVDDETDEGFVLALAESDETELPIEARDGDCTVIVEDRPSEALSADEEFERAGRESNEELSGPADLEAGEPKGWEPVPDDGANAEAREEHASPASEGAAAADLEAGEAKSGPALEAAEPAVDDRPNADEAGSPLGEAELGEAELGVGEPVAEDRAKRDGPTESDEIRSSLGEGGEAELGVGEPVAEDTANTDSTTEPDEVGSSVSEGEDAAVDLGPGETDDSPALEAAEPAVDRTANPESMDQSDGPGLPVGDGFCTTADLPPGELSGSPDLEGAEAGPDDGEKTESKEESDDPIGKTEETAPDLAPGAEGPDRGGELGETDVPVHPDGELADGDGEP